MSEFNIISLGAGVQSSTMLLMALTGEFEVIPEAAIFADTGWEGRHVYEHLVYLEEIASNYNFPIHRVSAGNIRMATIKSITEGRRFASLPAYVRNYEGKKAMLRRQCTREFKIAPLEAAQRGLMGVAKGERVGKDKTCHVWIGISTDEASRMRDSTHKWQRNYYPLIEKRMSRKDCIAWLEAHAFKIPKKSACIGCPYHDDRYWRDMKDNRPEEFADACDFDRSIRTGLRGVNCEAFLHKTLVPLEDADLSTAEERGQLNMFLDECEGMCGL